MQAACEVVARRGFAETRVADVAAQAGISTALVFYHFANKDQLICDAFAWAAEEEFAELDRIKASGGPAVERLARMLDLYSTSSGGSDWRLWIDAWAVSLRHPALQQVSRELDLRWQCEVAGVIREGVTTGEFRCDDPEAAAWRLGSLLDGLAIQVVVHEGLISEGQMRRWGYEAAAREVGLDVSALVGAASDRA